MIVRLNLISSPSSSHAPLSTSAASVTKTSSTKVEPAPDDADKDDAAGLAAPFVAGSWMSALAFLPRSLRLWTPRTKLIASIRFDLPAPLGPITAVKSEKGPITCWPPYDLKLFTTMCEMRPIVIEAERGERGGVERGGSEGSAVARCWR